MIKSACEDLSDISGNLTLSVAPRPVLMNPSSLVTSLTRKVSSKEVTLLNSFSPGTNHLMSRLLRSDEAPQSSRGNSDLCETILVLSARQTVVRAARRFLRMVTAWPWPSLLWISSTLVSTSSTLPTWGNR